MMFVKEKRLEILALNPGTKQDVITTQCGQMWNQLDEATKNRYKELATLHNEAKKGGAPTLE